MKQHLEWIESEGGPLLLAAKSVVTSWTGTQPLTPTGSTDYDRACGVKDEIGVISVGMVPAIVLGDEPDRTALMQHPSGLLMLRWRWAESEDSLVAALFSEGVDQLPFRYAEKFLARQDEYLLFDSACSGNEIDHSLGASLEAGVYIVETVLFNPSKKLCVLIHRLRAQSQI